MKMYVIVVLYGLKICYKNIVLVNCFFGGKKCF